MYFTYMVRKCAVVMESILYFTHTCILFDISQVTFGFYPDFHSSWLALIPHTPASLNKSTINHTGFIS